MSAAFDELLVKYIDLKNKYDNLSKSLGGSTISLSGAPQTFLTEPAPAPYVKSGYTVSVNAISTDTVKLLDS
jgi:hypothetical protein